MKEAQNTAQPLAERFQILFSGHQSAYGVYSGISVGPSRKDGKRLGRIRKTVNAQVVLELYEKHLAGVDGLGIIPIREDHKARFGCLDVDVYADLDHLEITRKLRTFKLPLVVCRSKSGGAHIYLFATEPVAASKMIARLKEVASLLGHGTAEVFPKQVELSGNKDDAGSWLNLPYYGGMAGLRYGYNSETEDPLDLEPFIDYCNEQAQEPAWFEKQITTSADMPPLKQLIGEAAERVSVLGGRNSAGLWLACALRDARYTREQAEDCAAEWRAVAEPLGVGRYTKTEFLRSVRQAYKRKPREPLKKQGPANFRADTSGVYAKNEKGEIRISGLVALLSEVRDEHSNGWSKLFKIRNRDGRDVELLVPNELLYRPAAEVLSRFVQSGLEIEATPDAERLFIVFLKTVSTDERRTLVSRIGWHGDQFVLPDRVIGANPNGEEIVYAKQGEPHAFNTVGSLDDWRSTIAARCAGNSRLVLGVSAAFAAPALHLLDSNGLGIHYRGASSCGKTTALRVAGSVQGGGPSGFIRSWRATGNALENVAESHNNALLALDEIGEADAKSIGQTAYMLANGSGKGRMRPDGTSRRVAEWNLLFLSSGEKSLSEAVADGDSRRSTKGGQELRLIDVPAECEAGWGLFEDLHGAPSARDFAGELNRAADENYGIAFVAWLELLAARGSTIVDEIKRDVATFMQERGEMSAEVGRVAGLFAVIGAAGEAARGITGWPVREALRAARTCFKAWLAGRGTKGGFDAERGVKQVRLFIQLHGSSSRFQGVGINEHGQEFELRSVNRLGYKREKPPGKWEFWILPEPWRDEICKGLDATSVAKELAERKLLLTDGRNLKVKRSVPEVGEMRVYVLKGEILDEGDTEEEQGEQSELWPPAA